MASLKEIKSRIASVSSTLKITSAMKLVASAKLRKAQQAIGNMLPYERQLHRILVDILSSDVEVSDRSENGIMVARPVKKVAIVAFSSNSSLCGAFNSNVARETMSLIRNYRSSGLKDSDITVYPIGRKISDSLKKAGFICGQDYSRMMESPNYEAASKLAQELMDRFLDGSYDKVELVYNHFKSTASQPTTRQVFLPLTLSVETPGLNAGKKPEVLEEEMPRPRNPEDLIIEPSPSELLEVLMPKVVRLRIFTTLLDSSAAEHAARTVAMQTATDNAEDLLQDLTLEYNKGRQQKITSEILDIVGGSLQK